MLKDKSLFEELNNQAAEKISGGATYTFSNKCDKEINLIINFTAPPVQLSPLSKTIIINPLNTIAIGYDQTLGPGFNPTTILAQPGETIFDCNGNQVVAFAAGTPGPIGAVPSSAVVRS